MRPEHPTAAGARRVIRAPFDAVTPMRHDEGMSALTACAVLLLAADGGTPAPLRVLVLSTEDGVLPSGVDPVSHELAVLEDFAASQRRALALVPVDHVSELEQALLTRRGDVIAAGLAVTRSRRATLAFTRDTAAVDEVVVGRKGSAGLPRRPEELSGKTVTVPRGSSYVEALEELGKRVRGVSIEAVDDVHSADQLAWEVARGQRALTVVDSTRLSAMARYLPELEPLFVLTHARPTAFALRPDDATLRAQLDAFLVTRAFTAEQPLHTDDLDAIKKRGTLRVLTRNNSVSFFLYRGNRYGFDYELARAFAKSQGLHLEVVVAPSWDALIPMLEEGKGDVIAASFTRTSARETRVAFSQPYLTVSEVLVQRKGGPVKRWEDLAGRKVTAPPSSSWAEHLAPFARQYGFTVVDAPEDAEAEDLLADVADGAIDFTVTDSHFLAAERLVRDELEVAVPLTAEEQPIAFAVRPGNVKLLGALDTFVKRTVRSAEYNLLKKRSFESQRAATVARTQDSGVTGRICPYDAVIKKYSLRYGFDWRLMAAQAWRESNFDPKARSFAGALGLFQVMPATGQELGFTRLTEVDQGTHAGIKYMAKLVARLEPTLPLEERVRFALAAYNAGFGRLEDARRLARDLKLNPDVWAGNVEKAMALLARPAYARRSRGGYCRCQEPVDYVGIIENKYRSYAQLVPP
ncbi:MAG: transporter substrate-binding domain-containing protein [Myxococcota bacterium]